MILLSLKSIIVFQLKLAKGNVGILETRETLRHRNIFRDEINYYNN